MDRRPIGVFDSGLGGLTAVKELMRILPGEDIVYFGDTGRVPYGPRGAAIITKYAREDVAFLLSHSVKAVVCACGTVSSVAGDLLAAACDRPFLEVVRPTARAACAATRNGRIGVIGTVATIRSGRFPEEISALLPGAQVFTRACPLFVPLVEEGHIAAGDPVTTLVVEQYLSGLRDEGIDTLVLGCTHYPLLIPVIDRFFGGRVQLIDSGREAAGALRTLLETQGLRGEGGGRREYYVTDSTEGFARVAEIFLGTAVQGDVKKIELDLLEASGGTCPGFSPKE